ncbi:MAG TPA: alpha/beta hydrolase [Stellaceae bacterium]|jgi:lysophospholipase
MQHRRRDILVPMMQPDLEPRFLEPDGFAWGRFQAGDGTSLRWGRLDAAAQAAPAEPRAHCVMVTGFKEYIEKYFETVSDLAARGLTVWCLDWRGQGGSDRPRIAPSRPRARDYDRDAGDLAAFAAAMLPPGALRVLIAHSMGGASALLCLKHHPHLFDAAVLSAPMLGVATGRVPEASARRIARATVRCGLGALFVPGGRRWRFDPEIGPARSRTSNDPARCRVHQAWCAARPELRIDDATYAWLDAALGVTGRLADPDLLGGIRTPILIASAGRDVLVRTDAQRRAAALLPNCTLVDLPEAKHEPFHEVDAVRDRWLAAIDRFLNAHLRDATPAARASVVDPDQEPALAGS